MNQETAERRAPSVYLVDHTGEGTYFAAATGKFDPKSWPARIEGGTGGDIFFHKRIDLGKYDGPASFSAFDVSSLTEKAPHKATIFYENRLQHTVELLGDGTTHHHLTIPKEVKIEGNQIALFLPVRLDSIEASRFNVFGVVIPRLVRGPSVDIHLPEKVDKRNFFAFTTRTKDKKTLGVMVEGAESVTVEAIPDQGRPIKDHYLALQLSERPEGEESHEVDFLTCVQEGEPETVREELREKFDKLQELEKGAQEAWDDRLNKLTQIEVETGDSRLKELVEAFEENKVALAKMHQVIRKTPREILRALIAGPKWPNQIFCRDAMINIPAALAVGLRKEAEETLTTFFAFQKKALSRLDRLLQHWRTLVKWGFVVPAGKAPHRTDRTGTNYTSMDSTPLMVSAIADYVRNTGNRAFLAENKEVLDLAVGALKAMIGDGEWKLPRAAFAFSRHGPFHVGQTWKDQASRWGTTIEVTSQFWQAFKSATYLYSLLKENEKAESACKMADDLRDEIIDIKKEEHYPDVIAWLFGRKLVSFENTPEAIWPYLVSLDELDEITKAAITARLEQLWVDDVGIRATQLGEKTLLGRIFEQSVARIQGKKEAYHGAKSIWPKNTGEAAAFLFQIGEEEKGLELLSYMAEQTDLATAGGIPETLRADGTVSDQCPIQAWSSGIYLNVFYRHLLGIDIDMVSTDEPTLTITPANLPNLFKETFSLQVKNVQIGKARVKVTYTNEGVTVERTDDYGGEIKVGGQTLGRGQSILLAYQ